ncbi:hypothetical protein [Flavobacterium sp.]|uniref:hypothetical protein n=1 Tax=Flavobacterium sp. TaxID=239 RepID=UPI00262EF7E6|nr:hypothetical protein [Flavobacterium sp.]
MKYSKKLLILFVPVIFLLSCEKDDVFTGSPVDSDVSFETLTGTISTNETISVAGQKLPVTITIPQAFEDSIRVQVTSFLPSTNKRTTTSVIIPKGQTSVDAEVSAPPTDDSDLPYVVEAQYFLSGINTAQNVTPVGFAGKQYSLTSNVLKVDFGDTPMPNPNANKLSVRLDYEFPKFLTSVTSFNSIKVVLKRLDGTTVATSTALTAPINMESQVPNKRFATLVFLSTAPDNTYIVNLYAGTLINSPSNIGYRFAVRFPDGKGKTFANNFSNLTVGPVSSAIAKLQIVKTTVDGNANYVVTPL